MKDKEGQIVAIENIKNRIFSIRGVQVMIDRDLAEMYEVETRRLNEQVKRNVDRFPIEFMFQLTQKEMNYWKSQIATSNKVKMGIRKPPLVFTEQGVSMLSAILKSKTAVKVSIQIINAFVEMRKIFSINTNLFTRLSNLEQKQIVSDIKQEKTEEKIDIILNAIEFENIKPKQGIFYNGQVFDAYKFVSDLIRTAKKSIILIDNYIDDSVLTLFTKRRMNVDVLFYTKTISKQLKLDIEKYNVQYPHIRIKEFKDSHDRFLILDDKEVYHIGASLKDLGKKWFAFSKFEIEMLEILNKLKKAHHSPFK